MTSDHYDRQNRPIGLFEWAALHDDDEYRRIALDELPDGTVVSTVWLGLDHNFSPTGPPLIFETAVFPGTRDWTPELVAAGHELLHPWDDQEMWRYPTEAAALAGHDQIVAKLSEAIERLRAACEEIAPDAGASP